MIVRVGTDTVCFGEGFFSFLSRSDRTWDVYCVCWDSPVRYDTLLGQRGFSLVCL